MRPQAAAKLLRAVVRTLGGEQGARSLTQALGRSVWIDFISDTGDDRDVSVAVARMLFCEYRLEDGTHLPRGDLLLFGGDTAYPVATADEIWRRLIDPWNEVLRESRASGPSQRRRVLLGVPGNHDWYDGLDGFARLFRRSAEPTRDPDGDGEGSPRRHRRQGRSRTGAVAKKLHLDEVRESIGLAASLWKSLRAFLQGARVARRKRLGLLGYDALQECSYFSLPLADDLDLWGIDRQLRALDFRQRSYFARRKEHAPERKILLVASDPAIAFGEPNLAGQRNLRGADVDFERDRVLYLTGDMHHYDRYVIARSMHVTAGGGGAFVHGTRMAPPWPGVRESACSYPDRRASKALLFRMPLRMMVGEAGFLPHMVFGALAAGVLVVGESAPLLSRGVVTLAIVLGFYFNAAHHRQHPLRATCVAVLFGVAMGMLPSALDAVLSDVLPVLAGRTAVVLVSAFLSAFVFGLFLAVLALLGIEHQQAFAALGHPGFKHFVRLEVEPSGRVRAWTIGMDDPLGPQSTPVLVDTFRWE
jgi:hypothetical protein